MLFFLTVCLVLAMPPKEWWLNSLGTAVETSQQFQELVASQNATLKDKHVIIDFYMKGCFPCFNFQPDWNELVGEMTESFGD